MAGDFSEFRLHQLLKSLWRLLRPHRRRQLGFLMVLMLVSAFTELVSLGSVFPFLGALTNPERLYSHPNVHRFAELIGVSSPDELVAPMTLLFVGAVLGSAIVRMLLLWATTKTTLATGGDLSLDVFQKTIYQPYSVHLMRNSSEIISGIIEKINNVVNGIILQFIVLLNSCLLALFISLTLIFIDTKISLIAMIFLCFTYLIISKVTKNRLYRNSARIAREQTRLVKILQDGLGGIRDILLDGTQSTFCKFYEESDLPLRSAQARNTFISQGPRLVMEACGMVMIAALAYTLSHRNGGIMFAIPLLGGLALGAQRLLPALQQAFSAWASVSGHRASLELILHLMNQPVPTSLLLPLPAPCRLTDAIRFDSVSFRYSANGPWIFKDLTLSIRRGSRVGFVGSTGSGKSTLLDLLMGLLEPTTGRILVDEVPISDENVRAWQRSIAHVPQSIYLADTTIEENIAFGVPPGLIDLTLVKEASERAQLMDFIQELPLGFKTVIGERGIRLSGGQRQRIGIARALYKQADLLILDEATSSLDTITEQALMDTIEQLDRRMTILFIAHRLATIRNCDAIFMVSKDGAVCEGTFDWLSANHAEFRELVTRQTVHA